MVIFHIFPSKKVLPCSHGWPMWTCFSMGHQVVQDQAAVGHDLGPGHGGQSLGHGWGAVDRAPGASQQRHLRLGSHSSHRSAFFRRWLRSNMEKNRRRIGRILLSNVVFWKIHHFGSMIYPAGRLQFSLWISQLTTFDYWRVYSKNIPIQWVALDM